MVIIHIAGDINYKITNSGDMSSIKNKLATSYGKSTRISLPSGKKVARDLREQFDDYVLRQQQEASQSNIDEQYIQNQELQTHEQFRTEQQQPNKPESILKRSSSASGKKMYGESMKKIGTEDRNKPKVRISSVLKNGVTIPKSYLIAMEHLQNLVQNKNEQINELKFQLIGKEEVILECQSRINEVLNKYNSLMDMYSLKESEVVILKQQMQQLRLDKQTALKQAARALQSQFKPYRPESNDFNTFKQRSISINVPKVELREPEPQLITNNSSRQMINSFVKENKSQNLDRGTYRELERGSEFLLTKNFIDPSHSSSRAPLLSQKSTNRDFISYQRQILRNEKQLIALKYRMECMERKLSADPKQQDIKNKIRKLSQQIEVKQKTINDLKKI